MLRKHYIYQLNMLRDDMLHMGALVEQALQRATYSLQSWNTTVIAQVLHDDKDIDEARQRVEEQVIVLIATQQPVASDLRLVGSVFAIAGELERIGDYACGIARRVEHIISRPAILTVPPGLFEMAERARTMVSTSMHAFLTLDATLAEQLQAEEEYVDAMETRLRDELIGLSRSNPDGLETAIDLIDVLHLLERTADRSTNIAERVIYIATSEQTDLNP